MGERWSSMNEKINDLTKELWEESVKSFVELEKIKLTLINIKISVAKINSTEKNVLSIVADRIAEAIDEVESYTGRIKDIAKEIAVENKE